MHKMGLAGQKAEPKNLVNETDVQMHKRHYGLHETPWKWRMSRNRHILQQYGMKAMKTVIATTFI